MKYIVESSWIKSYEVEEARFISGFVDLVLELKSGTSYIYYDIPVSVYKQFVDSPSKGQFFSTHIKNVYNQENLDEMDAVKDM